MRKPYLRSAQARHIRRVAPILFFIVTIIAPTRAALAQANAGELEPAVAARLNEKIQNGGDDEKRDALAEIRNLRSASASRLAVPALRDKDERVRATAAASVVFLPAAEASTAISPLLSDKAEFVRREAAYALGEVRHRGPVPELIRMMQRDKILEVRSAAAIALGKIGDASAIESLLTILRSRPKEDDEFLRRSAARSVGQVAQIIDSGDPSVLTPQNFLPEKFKNLESNNVARQAFLAAVDVMIRVLKNDNESDDTRREAAFALGAIGDQDAVATLQTYSSSSDPYMAEIAKEAILKIGRRQAAKPSGNSGN